MLTSLGWRAGLALVFSRHHVRRVYERFQRRIEALFGAFLMLFGLRLALSGRPR